MKKLISLSLPVIFLITLVACFPNQTDTNKLAGNLIPAPPMKRLSQEQYGIEVSNMQVMQAEVKRDQFLGDILTAHNVEYQVIDQIARNREIFDVRQMRVGNPFTILMDNENCDVNYFIYEKSRADFVVFDMRAEEVNIYTGKKPITKVEKEASGLISSSLYETIIDNEIDPSLAYVLENIYAWSIDFFYLQKGDNFKVVYEEEFVEGESIGISKVKGATFSHGGKAFHAVLYQQDGKSDYFDEEGNSLRKAFLKAPLKYSRISSRFSRRRFHPVLKRYRAHLGVDYAAPRGTPILAVGDGTILEATRRGGNGKFVKIKHNSVFATQYLHMSRFATGIKPGVAVKQGDVIGYVGSTGLATGPHVCFRFWKNGKQVNPLAIEVPPSEPVLAENRLPFESILSGMLDRLNQIPLNIPESTFASSEVVE